MYRWLDKYAGGFLCLFFSFSSLLRKNKTQYPCKKIKPEDVIEKLGKIL
jgi:hypothetical protein